MSGKASQSELRADYVALRKRSAEMWADAFRVAHPWATSVRVRRVRRGKPQAWGVFVTLPQKAAAPLEA
mgnify:CR=1 FL=1